MKQIKMTALLLCLLLTVTSLLTACDSKTPAADTTAPDTSAPVDTPADETPTEVPTEAPTDAETEPPADLSADELKALLSAAFGKETDNASVTIKAYIDEEAYVNQTMLQIGNNLYMESDVMGVKTQVTVLDDKIYYFVSMDEEGSVTELRYVLTPTAEEIAELTEGILFDSATTGLEDEAVTAGILNGKLEGKRYSDGSVELTCTELSADLITLLMGEPMEGATLSFEFSLDAEGRMTRMRFVIELPAELTGGDAVTVSTDTVVNYTPDPIVAPADADQYVPATYDELFGYEIPEADPDEAAMLGLPLDGDNYTIGGENPDYDPFEQYMFLWLYAPSYADKSFTLYGNVMEDEEGNTVLSLGEDMYLPIYFAGTNAPTEGSYVKLTATYTQTVDMGDYVDFECFTMMVSACEVLGEAKGPNGGKLMYITASSLNIRTSSDTSTNDNIIGTYSKGDLVEVFEQDSKGWYRVVYNGQDAYISNKYVSETKP